jgi:hypothetical protein
MLRLLSRFLRALFQFSKRAASESTKFGRSGVKLLGVVGAARLECGEPAAESGELIRRQLGNSFGDFFDFHGAQLTSSNLLPARQDIGGLLILWNGVSNRNNGVPKVHRSGGARLQLGAARPC